MLDHVRLVLTMAYVYMTEGVGRGFVNVSKNKNTEGRYWCECEIMTDLAGAAAEEKILEKQVLDMPYLEGFFCVDSEEYEKQLTFE